VIQETQQVQVHTFRHGKSVVHLIDTPGFDDTYRSDSDVLKDLAYWLSISYKEKNIKLTGIVYLHRITDVRMSGNAFKNLRTFKKMCGNQSMSSVVLATTMWSGVTPDEGAIRETDLRDTAEFWGDMLKEGSAMYRHTNDIHSALNIITHLINRKTTTVLGLQKEMVDLKRALDDTEAGREVEGEMIKQRQMFERKLKGAQEEMAEALAKNDKKLVLELAKEQEAFQKQIDAVQKGREELRTNMEKLIREKEAQHKKDMEDLDKKVQEQDARMKEKDNEFKQYMEEKRVQEEQEDLKRAETQKELDEARVEVEHGNAKQLLILQACIEAMQEQAQEFKENETRRQREAEQREADLQRQQADLQALQQQRAWDASYQQAMSQQQGQAPMWQQQQQQQQQQVYSQTVTGGALGIVGASALAMLAPAMACTVM
jgi:hypothetical protein